MKKFRCLHLNCQFWENSRREKYLDYVATGELLDLDPVFIKSWVENCPIHIGIRYDIPGRPLLPMGALVRIIQDLKPSYANLIVPKLHNLGVQREQ